MKNFLRLNYFKFFTTLIFIYLSSFFNSYFILNRTSLNATPKTFFIDAPINLIMSAVNQLFNFILPNNSHGVGFLVINTLASTFGFVLQIFYYYILASLIYFFWKKISTKKRE